MPLYGRAYANVQSTTNGLNAPYQGLAFGPREQGLRAFYEFPVYNPQTGQATGGLLNEGFVRYWDDQAKVPYLFNNATKVFINYEDTQSLLIKTDYVKSKGLAGVMFWELDWQVWDTLNAVKNRLITN